MSRFRLLLVMASGFLMAWMQSSTLEPPHERGVLPITPPTPFIHYIGANPQLGRVLVVHGLDVSKEVMRLISAALADGGFDVYAIDLPGHGDSSAGFQTDFAQQTIRNARAFLGKNIPVVGHSLGAGLLLDLAATDEFSTMVLLAPPPLSISEIRAQRVLIATGEMDIPRIRSFAPIAADIGTPHVEAWSLPWGMHSAPILNPRYVRRVVEWLGGDGAKTRTGTRMFRIAVMFVAAVAFGVALLPGKEIPRGEVSFSGARVLAHYVIASAIALVVLKFVSPLAWLRLFATDYLVGFLLVAGLLSAIAALYARPWAVIDRPYRLGTGISAAIYAIAIPGLLVISRVLHMSLSDGRWWRFPLIAVCSFPLFFTDEITLRRIYPRCKSDFAGLVTRGLFLAFILTGVLTLNRDHAFLVLIAPLIVIFWIALWFGAGVVHRHTQSPLAAALFSTIVQGWAFAAWFVTI